MCHNEAVYNLFMSFAHNPAGTQKPPVEDRSGPRFCQTCKWWGSCFDVDENDEELMDYSFGPGWRACTKAASKDGSAQVFGTLAYANDAEGYSAALMTRATFYCSMWEKKKAKEGKEAKKAKQAKEVKDSTQAGGEKP